MSSERFVTYEELLPDGSPTERPVPDLVVPPGTAIRDIRLYDSLGICVGEITNQSITLFPEMTLAIRININVTGE